MIDDASGPAPAKSALWAIGIIICVGLFEVGLLLQITDDFWFDDDATLFAFVAGVDNPLDFFIAPDVIAVSGFSLTPVQMFSYWIDLYLGGVNPAFAYVHSALLFILTAIMLFSVLRFFLSTLVSLTITIAWMLLPSTVTIIEFIGARHYMEGLFFLLCAFYLAYISTETKEFLKKSLIVAGALVFLFLAMLSKEVYVTSGFLLVLLLFACRRKFVEAGLTVVVGFCYVLYRLWAIGLSSEYPMPSADFSSYLRFLAKLPYIFSASYSGYILLAGAAGCGLYAVLRGKVRVGIVFLFALLVAVSLATIFPGSLYLSNDWQNQGTWYRLVFFLNLLFLVGGAYLVGAMSKRTILVMSAVLLVSMFYGVHVSNIKWDALKDRYNVTGGFYVDNSSRIVYSEVPAYWYLGGLKDLYQLKHPFVLSYSPDSFTYRDYPYIEEIWRYEGGKMVPDRDLWEHLKKKYR